MSKTLFSLHLVVSRGPLVAPCSPASEVPAADVLAGWGALLGDSAGSAETSDLAKLASGFDVPLPCAALKPSMSGCQAW